METKKSRYRLTASLPFNRDELKPISFSDNLPVIIVSGQLESDDEVQGCKNDWMIQQG